MQRKQVLIYILLITILQSCTALPTAVKPAGPAPIEITSEATITPGQPAPTSTPVSVPKPIPAENILKPGDSLGDTLGGMSVEQGERTLPYPSLWQFCDPMPDNREPTESVSECSFPAMSGLAFEIGWIAKASQMSANWESIAWELNLDGRVIDLSAFEWSESTFIAHGEDNAARLWLFNLRNLETGAHTLQIIQTMKTEVDDGFNRYQLGVYTHTVVFTILEKPFYPALAGIANTGVWLYHSKKAGLDFLLYMPEDYGKDVQQTWPLIVTLHGAHLRGATLELLMQEPLPKKLVNEADFPFVVVAPLGDGGYEFWAQDELITAIFTLLDEIQAAYAIDSDKIYLTGSDMGGNGVWAVGLQRPDYFAALAPIAGYAAYPFAVPDNICDLKDVPVWVFHGKRDEYVPVEVAQELVDALLKCGGEAQITILNDMKNDVPYSVYANPDLYEWFRSQMRK